jgi:hypothetical protein
MRAMGHAPATRHIFDRVPGATSQTSDPTATAAPPQAPAPVTCNKVDAAGHRITVPTARITVPTARITVPTARITVPAVVTLHRRLRRGSILTTRRNCGSRNSRSHRSRGRLTREQKEGRKEGRKGEESERVVETGAFSIPLETTPKT